MSPKATATIEPKAVTTSKATALIASFVAARRVSTPLLAVTSPDPGATMDRLVKAMGDEKDAQGAAYNAPVLVWDAVQGLRGVGKAGEKAAAAAGLRPDDKETANPVAALELCGAKLPAGSCVFMMNMHLFFLQKDPSIIQAIWNLRDPFKVNRRTLVMIGHSMRLPEELEADVIVLDEPLPTRDEIRQIIRDQYDNAGLTHPPADMLEHAADACTGLAAFTVEQVVAMSLKKSGVDIAALWERKRQAIEQTPGLTVWRGGETLDDIAGYANIKLSVARLKGSKREPRAVVFIDEIEKMIAGAQGDTSGVSQDQLGQVLSYMQDHKASGMILIGPPGAAKSMIAKATGNTLNVPTIAFDMGSMKGSLVGESEARIRNALKIVTSVSDDQALFIATCNSIGALPPELRRRFKRGTFFFDLPTEAERQAIWALYIRKFNLPAQELPMDHDWTGAEIAQCAEMAWDMGLTLEEAAEYVVPVAQSARETIDRLREQASERFISASYPGVYVRSKHDKPTEPAKPTSKYARAITAAD